MKLRLPCTRTHPIALTALLMTAALGRPDNAEPSTPRSLRAAPHKNDSPRELTIARDGRDPSGRVLLTQNHRNLGKIDVSSVPAAEAGARGVLKGLGNPGEDYAPRNNRNPNHLRFVQVHAGMEVQGAAQVVHADGEGNVVGVNGEHVLTEKLPTTPTIGAGPAMAAALEQSRVPASSHSDCQPKLAAVRDPKTGTGHLAWECTIRYDVEQADGSYTPFNDQVFAEAAGEPGLVALFPKIYSGSSAAPRRGVLRKAERASPLLKGQSKRADPAPRKTIEKGQRRLQTPSMQTQDCNQKTKNCSTVSTSSTPITTGDLAVDSAHNFAIATYNYYLNNHGRDSIDDNGMLLLSRVHYDRNYNNAFWDGTQMTYGDGDGVEFSPLSQDADVVAHELTHGVTERSSGLIYNGESGALNEAWSDIFGALVDRQEGATGADIWWLGEDIYTPNTPGDGGLRDMADPVAEGHYDWYPTRYTGTSDNGGVHWNSGIANLAFVLLVQGGTHPRGKSPVNVAGIGFDAAADAFYAANVNCLTSGSNFAAARYCTADIHGGVHMAAIHAAWDAVGVPNDPPPPPPAPITLTNGVARTGESLDTGVTQPYTFSQTVAEGSTVTCTTSASNGDADLYLRFDGPPETNPNSVVNECGSYSSNSNEACTTGAAPAGGATFYASVQAYGGYSNLAITCTENEAGSCFGAGAPCSSDCCNGCSGGKPGTRVCL